MFRVNEMFIPQHESHLFFHYPVEGHASCLRFLTIKNRAPMNTSEQVLVVEWSILWVYAQELLSWILGYINSQLYVIYPQWVYKFALPAVKCFTCSTSSPVLPDICVTDLTIPTLEDEISKKFHFKKLKKYIKKCFSVIWETSLKNCLFNLNDGGAALGGRGRWTSVEFEAILVYKNLFQDRLHSYGETLLQQNRKRKKT